jgi:hypothetical protein
MSGFIVGKCIKGVTDVEGGATFFDFPLSFFSIVSGEIVPVFLYSKTSLIVYFLSTNKLSLFVTKQLSFKDIYV